MIISQIFLILEPLLRRRFSFTRLVRKNSISLQISVDIITTLSSVPGEIRQRHNMWLYVVTSVNTGYHQNVWRKRRLSPCNIETYVVVSAGQAGTFEEPGELQSVELQ